MSAQDKNIAWFLPRPHPSHYKGGMPLHAEKWLLNLAREMLDNPSATVLHLFCGMCTDGVRVDLNPKVNPDYLVDVHEISRYIDQKFDIILADPPYSDQECEALYSSEFPKLNYKKWTAEADKLLNDGGFLIVYHKYIMPNPAPQKYRVAKRVFIGHRTYHVPRVAIYFQKVISILKAGDDDVER